MTQARFFFTVLFILSSSACTQHPQLPPLKSGAAILAFGDSLTYGTGAPSGASYPHQLERLSGFKVFNAGVPGEVTSAGLERLPAVIERVQPALMLLCHGGNDMLTGVDPAVTRKNISQMIEHARARGIAVLLIGVPKITTVLRENTFYAEIARLFQVPYEGKILSSILSHPEFKSDLIHPNAAGYDQLAQALFRMLKKSGAM